MVMSANLQMEKCPREWRLAAFWPQRLDVLPASAAVAIEASALTIRMLSSLRKNPDLVLPEEDKEPAAALRAVP